MKRGHGDAESGADSPVETEYEGERKEDHRPRGQGHGEFSPEGQPVFVGILAALLQGFDVIDQIRCRQAVGGKFQDGDLVQAQKRWQGPCGRFFQRYAAVAEFFAAQCRSWSIVCPCRMWALSAWVKRNKRPCVSNSKTSTPARNPWLNILCT